MLVENDSKSEFYVASVLTLPSAGALVKLIAGFGKEDV